MYTGCAAKWQISFAAHYKKCEKTVRNVLATKQGYAPIVHTLILSKSRYMLTQEKRVP